MRCATRARETWSLTRVAASPRSACLYFVVGFFGYAEFGLDISGPILKYYHVRSDPMTLAAYTRIPLKICVAYALSGQACRVSIYYLLRKDIDSCSLSPTHQLHLGITGPLCVGSLDLGPARARHQHCAQPAWQHRRGCPCLSRHRRFSGCTSVAGRCSASDGSELGRGREGLTYVNIIAGVLALIFSAAVTIGDIAKSVRLSCGKERVQEALSV